MAAASVIPMTTDRLPDRWESRDRPVLMEIARRLEAEGGASIDSRQVAAAMSLDEAECARVVVALSEGGYITLAGAPITAWGTGPLITLVADLTSRGRREVGLWPDQEAAADALVELLNQAADAVPDEHEAGALRNAGRLLRGVPSAVIADVTAALIRQQTGL